MQLTLDRFGRMVLPKAIRDGFGLIPGDVLDVEEQKDAIVPEAINNRVGALMR